MESHLKWPDYLILVGFFVISLAIGIYHSLTGGRQKTISEFTMGNRRLKVIPTAISMLVSFQSAILLLSHTAEIYSFGVQFSIFCIVANTVVFVLMERIIVPWLYPLKLVSIYEVSLGLLCVSFRYCSAMLLRHFVQLNELKASSSVY